MAVISYRRLLLLGALLEACLSMAACAEKLSPSPGLQLIENARQTGLPTIVEFGATSCTTCRNMKPILEATALELQGRAHVIVTDLNQDYAAAGPFNIRMMPTQIFFAADGREIARHLGGMAQAEIVRQLGFTEDRG